jgi:hypothetical protein
MGTREMTSTKNGRKDGTRNIENTRRKWSEKIVNITRNRVVVVTKYIRTTKSIVGIENAPMTNIVIT